MEQPETVLDSNGQQWTVVKKERHPGNRTWEIAFERGDQRWVCDVKEAVCPTLGASNARRGQEDLKYVLGEVAERIVKEDMEARLK